ncbi:PREDICTED: probable disease resistance protein At5g45510 isoform X2 [Tarenaya hassleriana]|uniref:probable disease resistance protein At5g45510 isoform X2 n=1 Tax=Tarenaya hassleriana TaxID=28532 RepID=UPI0008FD798E|nr:PREDICTED: probable disease resistance protein At5g45510 isoform X2 [Tarenaya hassleriana]
MATIDSSGEADVCRRIYKLLEVEGAERVLLAGKAGIGKTWVANEVCKLVRNEGSCYLQLWLHLNRNFDERSLYEDIAAQLCLFHEYEETEDDDGTRPDEEKEDDKKEEWEKFMAKIKKELMEKKNQAEKKSSVEGDKKSAMSEGGNAEGGKKLAKRGKNVAENKKSTAEKKMAAEGDNKSSSPPPKKYLLLVLNDEGSVTKEEEVMTEMKLGEFLKDCGPIKTLITRRVVDDSSTNSHGETNPETENNFGEIDSSPENNTGRAESDTKDETKALLDSLTEEKMETLLDSLTNDNSKELLKGNWGIDGSTFKSTIVEKSLGLPAAVVVLAKSLNCIAITPGYIEKVFKEVVPSESSDEAGGSQSTIHLINYVLRLGYELLKRNDVSEPRIMLDCFWHSLDFFKHCGCVYYRDLITHWILEGYFDPVRSVEKAYQEGHSVLMEFINRGILKIQGNNVVVPEVAMSNLIDLRYRGFFGTSHLGFSRVYGGDTTKGLGRITVVDDMVKTVQTNKKREKLTTVLVSGDRLRRETPGKFFENNEMNDLEILGLFNPTLDSLVWSLSKELYKLRFLVIRDYDLLEKIDELKELKRLQVLEVSGASSLENIPDDFFKGMSRLQSLNLSGLRIKSSPSSISELIELRCLILRDCPELEDLPEIHNLTKLEVIDLRGARELKTCFDKEKGEDKDKDKGEVGDKSIGVKKNKSKNKNFYLLTQLELLDLSESQIERLPIFQDSAEAKELSSLTRLLLRGCSNLKRLPNLKPLSGLQVLDLSGTTSLTEMLEVCFEDKKELRILNLSGTNLSELPSTICELSNLTQFLLKDCPNMEALPSIEELTCLEVFDVSGSTKLGKIEGSFKRMSYMREINLCGTKVKAIPQLPEHSSLCCSKYIVLPDSSRKKGENWRKIKELLPSGMFQSAGSSDGGATTSEISEHESRQGETFSEEPQSSVCPEKEDKCRKLVYHGNRYESLQENIRKFVPKSPQKIEEIPSCSDFSDKDWEHISQAAFVSCVDNFSASVSSVFDTFNMTSVKGCWVNKSKKMECLFTGEQHVEALETLWVSNLPLLKSLYNGNPEDCGFKNLKKLSIDCCPSIETLFLASQLPTSLEELHIKFCDKLEKVFGHEGEVPSLKTLHLLELPVLSAVGARLPNLITFTKRECPKLTTEEELDSIQYV